MRAGRFYLAARAVHASGAVFHRDRLWAAHLLIDLDAAETGEDVGYLAVDQRGPIKLGQDLNRQPQLSPRRLNQAMLGNRTYEVAAEQDHRAHAAINNFLASLDRVEALVLRRVDAEQLLELLRRYLLWLLRDANGSLPLHIGVTANRTEPGAGTADIAAHQRQIDHHLKGLHAFFVLGQSHPIDEHHRFAVDINRCGGF